MRTRLLTLLALGLALVAVAPAGASREALAAPGGLRGFLLRADEPALDTFPRTPSFAWTPYAGAVKYDFQLATSKGFDESSIVWSTTSRTKPLRIPAVAVPVALPWMTGSPYALYARVRARTRSGYTQWSTPYGFNMRWRALPEQLLPVYPGLVRWRPVEGATSYEVWFLDAGKVITTTTNVADQREYFTFHPTTEWAGAVLWRVRPVRKLYGTIPNGLPVVSHGPWSETFVSTNSDPEPGPLTLSNAVSETVSTAAAAKAHALTPGFVFTGNQAIDGTTARLFRMYIATDKQCVNVVFKGAVTGAPAYAPRTSGPLALPTTDTAVTTAETAFLADGQETGTLMADGSPVTTSEQASTQTTPATTSTTTTTSTVPSDFTAEGALVDLWDSGWPAGRYFWTVVGVKEVVSGTTVQYVDAEVPQDACGAGRVLEFGKASGPATTSSTTPYASGLSPTGQLVTAKTATPSFYRAALIAWQPALGATGYEVQWSRTKYPWRPAKPLYTAATSALLEGLKPGLWYYRVRGIDPYIPGPVKEMAWSEPVAIEFAKPTFSVERDDAQGTPVKDKTGKSQVIPLP